MDDPQKPPLKGSIEHLKHPPMPADPSMLDYAHGKYLPPEPRVHVGAQGTLGFASWIGAVAVFWFLMANYPGPQGSAVLCGCLVLAGLITLCIWLRFSQKWKGFIPGVMIGFFLTCLVPIGIVGFICFGIGRH